MAAALMVLALLGGLALVTARAERQSARQLEERFELRTELGANFTASYVQAIVENQRRLASTSLAGPRVARQQFEEVVAALGFSAAVLLDRDGRVLQVWPRAPEALGTPLGLLYPEFGQALRGEVGVSNIVSPEGLGTPLVGFAVPFPSSEGRRVLSGGFAIGATPLAASLKTASPFGGGETSLVDAAGSIVADYRPGETTSDLTEIDPRLEAAMNAGVRGHYDRDGDARFFASRPVEGTPWRFVSSVPENQLFAPVDGFVRLLPWLLLGAFALMAALAASLLWWLVEHRGQLRLVNRRLKRSNDELRDLDELKDEFVALVSHELRTPLTSITGFVSALLRERAGPVPPQQRELLTVVDRNAQRLQQLVGDLLLAAKSDAGKLLLEPEPVDLQTLVAQAVESARPHAAAELVELTVSGTARALLFADRLRIIQVLDNLLSNAIKFTPAGGTVEVGLTTQGSRAVVEVRDSGIGIAPAEQEQIFSRFFRASTATDREIQGSGLGLAVVKTIVDLHQGTIALSSREGVGTTFTVTFPLRPAEQAAA